MDAFLLLGLYAALLICIVFTLLFGQSEPFRNTPLPRLHGVLTEGVCDLAESAAARCCGTRGTSLLATAGELCCERSNPSVQILFLALLGSCYWAFWFYVFPMLPLPGVPAWHRHAGTAAALLCLALFLAASFGDPGTVTPANAAAHAALYPADGLLYEAKDCWTCNLPRPARSKHCSACGRCVARLDHHCIWLNSCVGLLNMRWFLAFLLVTAALAAYAAVVGWRAMAGDMRLHDTWHTAFIHPKTGDLVYLTESWRYTLHYLSAVYGPQASPGPCSSCHRLLAVTFFCAAAAWIVAGFLVYQLYLVCTGTTTAEVQKRRLVAHARHLEAEAAAVEARVARRLAGDGSAGSAGGSSGSAGGSSSGAGGGPAVGLEAGRAPGEGARGRRRRRWAGAELPNRYDRGVWRNLGEVLFPHRHLAAAAAREAGEAEPGGGKKRC